MIFFCVRPIAGWAGSLVLMATREIQPIIGAGRICRFGWRWLRFESKLPGDA